MSKATTVLITGGNRGLGLGLVTKYLLRQDHTVIAGVRDPSNTSSTALSQLPCGQGSKVILVKIDSNSDTDAQRAIDELRNAHGITHLDIVIANAGISNYFGKARVTPAEEMMEHYRVNTIAPLLLFQASAPLLDAAAPGSKFVTVSSGAGSISGIVNLPVENAAYGASKAALNFVTRRISYENPELIAFSLNPGWLQTDLGNHAARGSGSVKAPMTVEDGVQGVIDNIDRATRATSGMFLNSDGKPIPW